MELFAADTPCGACCMQMHGIAVSSVTYYAAAGICVNTASSSFTRQNRIMNAVTLMPTGGQHGK